jgi:hypothetical protein
VGLIKPSAPDSAQCQFCGVTPEGNTSRHQAQHGRLSGDECVGHIPSCRIDILWNKYDNTAWIKHLSGKQFTAFQMTKRGSLDELREFCDNCHTFPNYYGCGKEEHQNICGELDSYKRLVLCNACATQRYEAGQLEPVPEPAAPIHRRRFRLER